ncbi:MAG: Bacterial proteasome-activating AAA-ATPase (PAN), partial [uncultured Nocardioidaceae bacterium]
ARKRLGRRRPEQPGGLRAAGAGRLPRAGGVGPAAQAGRLAPPGAGARGGAVAGAGEPGGRDRPERPARRHPAGGAGPDPRAEGGGRAPRPAAERVRRLPHPPRRRHGRRLPRRPQDARGRQPGRRARRAPAGAGGHAQRGHERRARARVRAPGRRRHAQGAARGRGRRPRPGPGHRPHRRRARGDARRLAQGPAAQGRRLPAAREPQRLRLRAHPEVGGRGARPRGGPRHRLRRHRRPGHADRADPRRRRAAVPAQGPVQGAPAASAQGRAAVRPARVRQDAHRQGRREQPGQEGRAGDRQAGRPRVLPEHQGPGAAEQVRRRDRAPHPAGVPAGAGEGLRGHAGHRLLRRDGLHLPHPRVGRELRRRDDHRPAAAQRDRRCGDAGERRRHRRVQPRGHDRPGDPAARPARREDQDRAPGRRGGPRHLRQVHRDRAAAARGGPRRARRQPPGDRRGHDPARRRAHLHRGRGEPLPRGHLRQRRQGGPVLQGLQLRRHDREHRRAGQEDGHQGLPRDRRQGVAPDAPHDGVHRRVQGERGPPQHHQPRRLGPHLRQEGRAHRLHPHARHQLQGLGDRPLHRHRRQHRPVPL